MRFCRQSFFFVFLAVIAGRGSALAADPTLFTPEEQRWLAEHPQINIVVNGHPAPVAIWNDPARPEPARPGGFAPPAPPRAVQGAGSPAQPRPFPGGTEQPLIPVGPGEQHYFQGVAAEYLEQVAELTGLNFNVVFMTQHNFRAAFAAMRRGEVDILPAIMHGHRPPPGIVFSAPYVEVPVVVVMPANAPRLEDISRLETMDVAGVLPIQAKLDSLGLQKRIRLVTPHDGLVGVATGKYDAFIADLSSISHELRHRPVTNIKIAGELPAPSAFSAAVSDRLQEIIPILDKAIRAIPQEKKDEIWQRWFPVRDERQHAPDRWFWVFGGITLSTLLLGGLGLIYNRGHLRKIRHGIAALEPHLLCVHTDHTITITGVTEALCEVTGFTEEDLLGKPLRILGTPPVQGGGEFARLFESVAQGKTWKGEVKLVRRDGGEIWTDVIISPTRRKNDQVGYTVIYQDASKRKHYEKLATRDELTGLNNRRHFNAMAPELLRKAAGSTWCFALFLLDVDNFKQYNDTYGHPAGDRVLTAIGRALKEIFKRNNECCFRLGGEEFGVAVLLPSADEVPLVADRILCTVRDLKLEHRHNPPGIVTVSIGSALGTGKDGLRVEELYRLADANLYRAKESGRDRHAM